MRTLRWVAIVGVLSSAVAAVAAFVAGAIRTGALVYGLATGHDDGRAVSVHVIQLMDASLVGAALLLFSFGLYELFIDRLELPPALTITTLDDLKGKLASVVVLVLCVDFLEHFVSWEDGVSTLQHAAAAALVSAVLLALIRYGRTHA